MANGIDHAVATRRNGVIISVLSVGATALYGPLPLLFLPGVWLGHWITPDFDLSEEHPIYVQRKIIQKHKIIGWLLWAFWFPYAKLCIHRGMSHSYPLGTLIRMVYTLWIPTLLAVYFMPEWFTPDILPAWYAIFIATFIGWSIQDITHLYMDSRFYKKHFMKTTRKLTS